MPKIELDTGIMIPPDATWIEVEPLVAGSMRVLTEDMDREPVVLTIFPDGFMLAEYIEGVHRQ